MSTTLPLAPRVDPGAKPPNTLQRERHEPEYGILVAIVALAAIGILMVYSSSAMKAYLQKDDTFAIVGPQIQWAALGVIAMVVMMRVDYRWLRVASVPMFVVGIVGAGAGVRARAQRRGRRLGPLAQDRAAAGGPPGRVHEARARGLPRPLVRQAGERRPRVLVRHGALPRDHRARSWCWCSWSRTSGTSSVLGVHGVHDVLPRRREPPPPGRAGGGGGAGGRVSCSCAATRWTASRPGWTPGTTHPALGFHSVQGFLALALGGAARRRPRREPAGGRPVPAQRLQRLHLRDHRRGVRAARRRPRDRPVPRLRLPRHPHVARARRTRSGRCWRRGSRPGSASRRSSTSGSWWG